MKKSLYSFLLLDEVVEQLDRLAYLRGMSRSALVNRILAEYVSLRTPQQYIGEVLERVASEAQNAETLQVQRLSATMLALRSVLNFKYNPTIRYSVELTVDGSRYICEFKAISRTQSRPLLNRLNVFFELWSRIEQGCLAGKMDGVLQTGIQSGRFVRSLVVEHQGEVCDAKRLGGTIGAYIRLFDGALKIYFGAEYGMDRKTYQAMTELYERYLEQAAFYV